MTNPVYTQEDVKKVMRNIPQREPFGVQARKKRQRGWSFWPPLLPNPGKYDELQSESREVMGAASEAFDGVKIDISKGVAETLSVLHSFAMTNDQNVHKYAFQIQGVPSPTTMVFGRIDSDYNVQGKWQQIFTNRIIARFSGQASREAHNSGGSVEIDYQGDDWYGQFMWNNPGMYRMTYHQALTHRLSAGGELAYNHKQAVSLGTVGIRYLGAHGGIWSLLAAIPTVQLSYFFEVNSRFEIAIEYLFSAAQGIESKLDLGYALRFPEAEVKSHIDSQWHCHTSLTTTVHDPSTSITLFGDFDYKKKKFGVGIGLNIQI